MTSEVGDQTFLGPKMTTFKNGKVIRFDPLVLEKHLIQRNKIIFVKRTRTSWRASSMKGTWDDPDKNRKSHCILPTIRQKRFHFLKTLSPPAPEIDIVPVGRPSSPMSPTVSPRASNSSWQQSTKIWALKPITFGR